MSTSLCQCEKPLPSVERVGDEIQYRCLVCDRLIVVSKPLARAAMFREGQARS